MRFYVTSLEVDFMDEFHDEVRTRSERHQQTFRKKIKRWVVTIGIIFILFLICLTTIVYGGKLIVNDNEIVLPATTTIVDEKGTVLWELYEEYRKPIPLDQIPDHVQQAFIAVEDRRFYSHGGVDFQSIIRAIYRDIIAMSKVEGGSTITQQLAKNLFLTNEKTWLRKTKEVMVSLYLERELTKDEIMELYLNTIYFGHGAYGIEAAAERFFSKQASELTLEEGALLAGLVKAPNSYSPIEHPEKAKQRRDIVLQLMTDVEMISENEREKAQAADITLKVQERKRPQYVESYIDLVLKEAAEEHNLSIEELQRGGYRIVVAIDVTFQQIAFEHMKNEAYFPGNTDGVEGAFVAMEQESGKIVTAIGGRQYKFGDLNRVIVKRQPGSTIKPIAVYGPAMMTGTYDPYTLIPDQKIDRDGYIARNYDDDYDESVSIYTAVEKSKNAPAVWLLESIGIPYSKSFLEKMNIELEDEGLAIALGGLSEGLTPIQMVESYRPFAQEGKFIKAYTIVEIYDRYNELILNNSIEEHSVFSPQVAWNMTEMLLNVVENGTGKVGYYNKALAGKTGSTGHPHSEGNYKDAWFVGNTPEFSIACWMGFDHSDEDHYLVKGSEAPTILTKDILSELDRHKTLRTHFDQPENVQRVEKPIELPKVTHIEGKYIFEGSLFPKGKLTWDRLEDKRVVFRIYQVKKGIDERVGEVIGQNEFVIEQVNMLESNLYYIVPYDPLTKIEGEHSEIVQLRF